MAQVNVLAWVTAALLAWPGLASAQPASDLQDRQALDARARAEMEAGDLRTALRLMREHVAAHPDDHAARLDLVRYLTWSGDYARAQEVLRADPAAEQGREGQRLLAGLLAWGGRIDEARAINAPLLADDGDLLAQYTQAVALRQSARPRTALPYVEAVKRLRPGSKDAIDVERATRVRTASFVSLGYSRGDDSDDLVASRPTVRAEVAQGEALRYTSEFGRWDHSAPVGGPFAAIDGGSSVAQARGLLGVRHALSLRTQWSAAVGHSEIDGGGEAHWRVGVDHRASDSLRLSLTVDRDRLQASARSISLGITRDGVLGQVHWTPDLRWTGDIVVRRDWLSDDNRATDVQLALRRAVVRTPGFMLDIGGMLQHQSFDRNPSRGYYAPDDYRRYGVTAFSYFALSDDIGLSLQATLGRQRDETFDSWRRASDLNAEMVFGIFSSWQFAVVAAYSERVQPGGAYDGRSWGATLTRRF